MDLAEASCLPVAQLLPHREPMIFLDEACGMQGEHFVARVSIRTQSPFFDGEGVPAWIGIEYMAQAIAAYAGAEGLARGGSTKVGLLLGTRDYAASVPSFTLGQALEVLVKKELVQANGVSSLQCRLRCEGITLAEALITVIQLPEGGLAALQTGNP